MSVRRSPLKSPARHDSATVKQAGVAAPVGHSEICQPSVSELFDIRPTDHNPCVLVPDTKHAISVRPSPLKSPGMQRSPNTLGFTSAPTAFTNFGPVVQVFTRKPLVVENPKLHWSCE